MIEIKFEQKLDTPIVIALGFFDAMHKGHMALVDSAKKLAKLNDAKVALFTFSNNHFKTLGSDTKLIYSFEERKEIYQNVGVEVVLSAEFTKEFMSLSAETFLNKLCSYNIQAVVCGDDYTCGKERKNSVFVSEYLNNKSTMCEIVHQISDLGERVSSSRVRRLLQNHEILSANSLLSEDYFICGKVVDGRKVGRVLGFPTANVLVDNTKLLVSGVYGCRCNIDGKMYDGILNIGAKPTFDIDEVGVEVHFIDFEGDLYGKQLKIVVSKFLREIKRFDSREELINQLTQDIKKI